MIQLCEHNAILTELRIACQKAGTEYESAFTYFLSASAKYLFYAEDTGY